MKLKTQGALSIESDQGVRGAVSADGGLDYRVEVSGVNPALLLVQETGTVRLVTFPHPDDRRRFLAFRKPWKERVYEVFPDGLRKLSEAQKP